MEMKRKPFAKQFEKNANFQIKRLHDAIYRYGGSVSNKVKLYRYVSGKKQLGLMQPRALKPFARVVKRHLEECPFFYKGDKYPMFTFVADCDFGKSNWKMKCDELQKQTKRLLKGHDYIARVCLDEFPRAKYFDEGTLMCWHVHGIFFKELSRWYTQKINQEVKATGYKIRPLVTKRFDCLIDAVHYAFKMPFGGKVRYQKKDGTRGFRHTTLSLKAAYNTFMHLKNAKIYDFMFAGGKGKKVLNRILAEIKNEKA